jgi:hypothetical protein
MAAKTTSFALTEQQQYQVPLHLQVLFSLRCNGAGLQHVKDEK